MANDLIDFELLRKASLEAVKEVYLERLKAATPKATSITSKRWRVREVEPFVYEFFNDTSTKDGKLSIVQLLVDGTKPHRIPKKGNMPRTPGGPKALHWQKGKRDFFAKWVKHPGFAGRDFVKQILDDEKFSVEYEQVLMAEVARMMDDYFSG